MSVNVSGYLCAGVYLEEVCSYRLSYREERLLRIADCLYPRREQDTCCQEYSDGSQDGNMEQRPHDSDRVRSGRVLLGLQPWGLLAKRWHPGTS